MSKLFSLEDKKILVTGASSGIGRAVAKHASSLGASVILTGRDENKLLKSMLLLNGDNHVSIAANLSIEEDIDKVITIVGNIDGIVHCAGIMKTLPFKFVKKSLIDDIFDINFKAPMLLTQKLLYKKSIQKGASLIFITSISGLNIGAKGNTMYSATKGAINGMITSLALELSSQNIRVNAIAPGMVKTEMWKNETSRISIEQLTEDEKKYPLGYGTPEDIAYSCMFLLSNEARWITGSTIVIDGGFSIQ